MIPHKKVARVAVNACDDTLLEAVCSRDCSIQIGAVVVVKATEILFYFY